MFKFLSDNWKSFTSPEKELQTWVRDLDEDLLIRQTCANATWRFTPPYGPHHGGIYETMVKATKRAFSSLFTEADLNLLRVTPTISLLIVVKIPAWKPLLNKTLPRAVLALPYLFQ